MKQTDLRNAPTQWDREQQRWKDDGAKAVARFWRRYIAFVLAVAAFGLWLAWR